ncbi:MAG TPA: DUF4383 domain-containing protein [Deinococcales bacterium]|nr:DUF4383 domain-containing protein [Deinococcales bacterium]
MTTTQTIARVFGVVFLLVGLLGFVTVPSSGLLLGIFPVNTLHHIVHLAIGAALLAMSGTHSGARSISTIVGATYLLVGILGFITPNFFGLMPIHGNDIWLHLLSGAVLLYAGMAGPADATATRRI